MRLSEAFAVTATASIVAVQTTALTICSQPNALFVRVSVTAASRMLSPLQRNGPHTARGRNRDVRIHQTLAGGQSPEAKVPSASDS